MFQLYRDRPLLILGMIFANIALSAWCFYLDPVINFDGVIYVTIAELFERGEINKAFDYYSWPFYSAFVTATAKVFFIELETAAFVFNTAMVTSLTFAFVSTVSLLSNHNRKVVLIAVAVILLFPSITKYRSFVIRDFGYLSCYLWSLYFILKFCSSWSKHHLIGWLFFAAASSLFRIEGILFVLIAPYFLFLFGATAIAHRKKIIALLSVIIVCSSVALLFWYLSDKYSDSVELARLTGKDIHSLGDFFADNISQRLGGQPLTLMSFAMLVAANIWDVSYELIRRMAIFYLLIAAYGYFKGDALSQPLQRKIWGTYLVANLIMLIGFSMSNNFIVGRYTMATALTLLLLVPATIAQLWLRLQVSGLSAKLAAGFAVALLVFVSLEGLDVRTKKNFIKEAGIWSKQNLPNDSAIYSNDKLAIYYADRGVENNIEQLYSLDILTLFLKTNQIATLDYVILVGRLDNHKEDVMRQTLTYRFGRPEKIIWSKNKQRYAFIFNIQKRRKQSL